MVGNYKYDHCVVFRSSHLGISYLLSFYFFLFIQIVKQDKYMKQNGNSLSAF